MSNRSIPELEAWLNEATRRGARELFLIPGEPAAFRVEGGVVRMDAAPLTAEAVEAVAVAAVGKERVGALGGQNGVAYATVRLSGELHAAVSVARSGGRLTVWCRPMADFIFNVEQVRAPQAMITAVEAASGLVIVSGRHGSGKTTTCYALLEHLNATRDVHMVMAQYYAEYAFEPKRALIQQRQVGADAPDMLSAIHSALLQSPDVLFVSEIRDVEVLQACVSAAEAGHLVLIQLHQATPQAAVSRIIELQPEDLRPAFRRAVAGTLRGVSAQVLLPRADGKGRVPAYGVLVPDDEMRAAIVSGQDPVARELPLPVGCQSISEDVARLVDEGLVTAEAAREALAKLG
jgi:twitching motility protein PilT